MQIFNFFMSGALSLALLSTSINIASVNISDTETPDEVQICCIDWGIEYDICPELLEAICFSESRYTADIENGTCIGIMQINKPIHKNRMKELGVTDLKDIDQNIHVGADIISDLFEIYGDDPAAVLMAYHGEKNPKGKADKGNISKYAQSILDKSAELERLHGK